MTNQDSDGLHHRGSHAAAKFRGELFLTGESMVADEQGANFGPEMSALANCFKTRFALGQEGEDIPLIYTATTCADSCLYPQSSHYLASAANCSGRM